MRLLRPVALLTLVLCASPAALPAQGVALMLAGLLGSPAGSQISIGYTGRPLGPLDATLTATHLGEGDGDRWGAGIDITLWREARARVYPAAGLLVGLGTGEGEDTWASWSLGLGYRLVRSGGFALALEGRYLHLSPSDDALTLGIRMGLRFGGRPGGASIATTTVPVSRSGLAEGIIQTAIEAMGTPYVWGGSDANGFDCSGLIRHAYAQHGIELPRRSADQAAQGIPVPRDLSALLPGDILAFGSAEARVTHVGLYLGDGRFIHSARGGVQISVLSPDDPSGRYWWQQWVGARRILQG